MTGKVTSQLCTAIHEVGHAISEAVFEIGPQSVRIFEVDGRWEGQALPSSDANIGKTLPALMATQLAGPAAQISIAPASLGDLQDKFRDELLNPCIAIFWPAPNSSLNQLGWIRDLECNNLIYLARSFRDTWNGNDSEFYFAGEFLFHAERALFAGFNHPEIRQGVPKLARSLTEKGQMSQQQFLAEAKLLIDSKAWAPLRSLDLAFELE